MRAIGCRVAGASARATRALHVQTVMPGMDVYQVPALQDNYVYLVHHLQSDTRICVDPSEAAPVADAMDALHWPHLDVILCTHWHPDHTDGNLALKSIGGAGGEPTVVIGPRVSHPGARAIPGLDREVAGAVDAGTPAEELFEGVHAHVLDLPGHTLDHIGFYFSESHALFSGDTLFPMGCGRLFEGTPAQMHASLDRIRALPADTQVFCAHE